jgi:hypothetical protein
VKIQSLRSSLAGGLLVAAAGLMLAACGGGGAATSTGPNQGGLPVMQPDGATFYAGIPNTIVITGGKRPYVMTSSEPSVLPVPLTVNSSTVEVVPANPGVIDTGLPAGSLPIRTVNIQLRDAAGNVAAPISIKVGQNFLTGYGVAFNSNCPTVGSATTAPAACAGGETELLLQSVTNGSLHGNRAVRFEVLKGPFSFVQLPNATIVGNTYTTTTDHEGKAIALIRVNQNVPSQLAVLRVIDVATGVYVDQVFPISTGAPRSTLTAIPNAFTFTAAQKGVCGTGSGQFLVFDGIPPYTALSSDPNVSVSPSSTNANPGLFTISAFNPGICLTGSTIVITDSTGARTTVTVDTKEGTAEPTPPPPVAVAPATITLACGTSGSVSVVGGAGGYIVNSTHPRVTAVASGTTITITRLAGDAGASFPTTGAVSITDGSSTATVTLTVPANCP